MLGPEVVGRGRGWTAVLRAVRDAARHRAAPPPTLPGHAGGSHFSSSAPLSAYFPEAVKGFVQSISYLMQQQELSVDIALSITACAEGAGGTEGCAGSLGFGSTASAAWPNQALYHWS